MSKLPSVSGERVIKALKRAGFVQLRQKRSHVSLEKRIGDKVWKTVVPMHSEVAKGTLSDILKQAALRSQNSWRFYNAAKSTSTSSTDKSQAAALEFGECLI
jgi:predicted RNA binding protein YcfA (HicA-like mRNA interferase family)